MCCFSPPETLTHGKQPEEVLQEEAADHIQCERERCVHAFKRVDVSQLVKATASLPDKLVADAQQTFSD